MRRWWSTHGERTAQARRPRALVLSMYYRPEPNFITADVADLLAQHADVTVVTAHPNYPTGRFHPSVRRWWWPARAVEGGVVVWRLPIVVDRSTSMLRRAVSYASFLVGASVVVPFVARGARLVCIYQTPFTTALAALWLRLVHGARLAYLSVDLWPESFGAAGLEVRGPVMRALHAYRRWINRFADLIVCGTQGMLRRFREDGVDPTRLAYVPPWVEGIPPRDTLPPVAHGGDDTGTIVYAGNMGPAQHLETVVRAAGLLEAAGVGVRFDLYGSGVSEAALRTMAAELAPRSVTFHGRVPPAVAFDATRNAFAQLVILAPSPLFRVTVPSKLSFAFAAAAPLLYGLEGEAAAVAASSSGAIGFSAADPSSLAAAIQQLLACTASERAAMRAALRHTYVTEHAREELLERLRALLLPMLASGGATRGPA